MNGTLPPPATAGAFPTSASASACAPSTTRTSSRSSRDVDWFEILSENFMDTGGRPAMGARPGRGALPGRAARRLAVDRQHRSARPRATSRKLKALADRTSARWVSDHLCWTGVSRPQHPRPAARCPTPRRRCATSSAASRPVSDVLERPLVLENPSTYVEFAASSHDRVGVPRPARRRRPTAACCSTSTTSTSARSTTASTRRPTSTRSRRTASCSTTWPATPTRARTSSTRTTTTSSIAVWELYRHARGAHRRRLDAARVGRGHPRVRRRARRGAQGAGLSREPESSAEKTVAAAS